MDGRASPKHRCRRPPLRSGKGERGSSLADRVRQGHAEAGCEARPPMGHGAARRRNGSAAEAHSRQCDRACPTRMVFIDHGYDGPGSALGVTQLLKGGAWQDAKRSRGQAPSTQRKRVQQGTAGVRIRSPEARGERERSPYPDKAGEWARRWLECQDFRCASVRGFTKQSVSREREAPPADGAPVRVRPRTLTGATTATGAAGTPRAPTPSEPPHAQSRDCSPLSRRARPPTPPAAAGGGRQGKAASLTVGPGLLGWG